MIYTPPHQYPLSDWLLANRPSVEAALQSDGFVLFRNSSVNSVADFEAAAAVACAPLYADYGDLPSAKDAEKSYFSTIYPSDLEILYHNEASHTHTWPNRQVFYCRQPAVSGGEWTLVDGRAVVKHLDRSLLDRFLRHGLVYRRRFYDHLDVSWTDFFKVNSLGELRERFEPKGYEIVSTEEALDVSYKAPAIFKDDAGAEVWFNQVLLHHPCALPVDALETLDAVFACRTEFPRYVAFGDGSEISADELHHVHQTMRNCSQVIPTTQGDVLLLNNRLVAHGRLPYRGDREVRVALGAMGTW